MNKLRAITALLCVGMAAQSLMGAPASAETKRIDIVVNGETLVTEAEPYITGGTTFVPFRSLFEKLGLTVEWNGASRQIVGKGPGTEIVLQVGSQTAYVDGTAVSLPYTPTVKAGRTYVPLRFVGEAAEGTVQWNGAERKVTIHTAAGPAPAKPAPDGTSLSPQAFYEDYVHMGNREDAAGIIAIVDPGSPLLSSLRAELSEAFRKRDIVTTIESLELLQMDGNTAVLSVIERHERNSGAFYMDNRVEANIVLLRTVQEGWKLYNVEIVNQEWLIEPRTLPEAEVADINARERILSSVSGYLDALRSEDAHAAIQRLDAASPLYRSTSLALPRMFAEYDLTYDTERVKLVGYTAGEAHIYVSQVIRKAAGPKFADVRTETVYTLREAPGGSWKLYASSIVRSETMSLPQ